MTAKELIAFARLLEKVTPIFEEEGFEIWHIEQSSYRIPDRFRFLPDGSSNGIKPYGEDATIRIVPMVQEDSSKKCAENKPIPGTILDRL